MKALRFEKTGDLSYLQIKTLESPQIRPDSEALVRIRAAAINPSDPKNVLGKMPQTKPPRTPGRDFAGVVVEGPREWVGKEVFGTGGDLGFGRDGTHAELAAIPVDALVEKPADLSFEQAAALGVAYLTAWSTVVTAGQVSSSDVVFVTGATGAVGSAAVKIAKHLGAKQIIGALRQESERSRTSGIPADQWIDLERSPLPQGVLQATSGRGADVIIDVIGGPLFEPLNHCLAHRGRHVVIASATPEVTLNLNDFYHREGHLIGVDSLKLSFAQSAAILRELLPLVRKGILTPPAFEAISLEQASVAYRAVLGGTARKKIVIGFG